jgi:hypothetical protein
MESNNVIDFAVEKEKRQKELDSHYPNEGPVPLNERMMNAAHKLDKRALQNKVVNYDEAYQNVLDMKLKDLYEETEDELDDYNGA